MDHATEDRQLLPVPEKRRTRRRWRTYSIGAVAGLTMLAGQCAPQQCAPAPAAVGLSPQAQQVVDLTNQRRADVGLPALAVNGALTNAAQAHSNDQAARDRMGHDGSDGSRAGDRITAHGYRFSKWGENVGMGYPDAASVMDAWMNSEGHRRNIVDSDFTQIGVALAYAPDGTPYWTQVFARPG